MAASFQLQIFTQEKKVFDEQVVSLIVPAASGYLGVLAHHAPLVALLGEGTLTIKNPPGEDRLVHVAGGFLEVRDNVATMLVDAMDTIAALQLQPREE